MIVCTIYAYNSCNFVCNVASKFNNEKHACAVAFTIAEHVLFLVQFPEKGEKCLFILLRPSRATYTIHPIPNEKYVCI